MASFLKVTGKKGMKDADKKSLINVDNIARAEEMDGGVVIFLKDGSSYFLALTIDQVESALVGK